jgi:hypothetical protein
MISRYIIIALMISTTIPAFADNPVKTNCDGRWTVYQEIWCGIDNIRDFFLSSMDKQDVIIAQNIQIEKLLIQQNKLQSYNYCIQKAHYSDSFESVDDYVIKCNNQTLDKTK